MNTVHNYYSETNPIVREDLNFIALANLPWSDLHNKTVLVTGGGGFLASYIIKALLKVCQFHKLNIKIICVVRSVQSINYRLSECLGSPNFSIFLQDISQPFNNDFPRADYIIHSASQASPKYYGIDPVGTLLPNSVGTSYLLEHAAKHKTEKFLFFSSAEVYGVPNNGNQPIGELDYGYIDPMSVRSCYAESKRVGETMCMAWTHQFGLHTNVVRPFHTYGPGMALDDGRVFADFVADVVQKRDIVLKSDGLAKRSFCYIADATVGFFTILLLGEKSQAYNLANSDAEISMKDLASLVAGLFPERNVQVRFDVPLATNSYLSSPVLRSTPSVEKIKLLGWTPRTNLQDGFRRTIQSYL